MRIAGWGKVGFELKDNLCERLDPLFISVHSFYTGCMPR